MVELSNLSIEALRDVAGRLAVENAGGLPRAELETRLSARLGEVVSILNAGEADGKALGTVASGAGKADEVPLEPPRVPIADLPWAYEDDRLVLLVRDPRTLFAYWDFHPDTVKAAKSGLPEGWAKLRLVGFGRAEPEILRELDIQLDWRAYYLYDVEPNRDYRVEIVFRGPNGEERLVGRGSNVVTAPPNQPSAWVDDRFVRLSPDQALPQGQSLGGRAFDAERRLHQRAYELSGGEAFQTGDEATSSDRGLVQGFGGRAWSGNLVKK